MYDNIGGKIKGLAKAVFIVEAIASVITGIALLATDVIVIPIGLLVMVGGPLVAWISSWLTYGFGELIDKTCDIARSTPKATSKATPKAQSKVDYERFGKIERLRSQGLINEEEYQQAISKEK